MYDVKNKESYYSLCYLEVLLTCSGKLSLRVSLSTCQHEVSLGFYVTTREIPKRMYLQLSENLQSANLQTVNRVLEPFFVRKKLLSLYKR